MLTQHPLSAAFPVIHPDEFQELKDSIMVVGVLNPITLYEGQVLDGWHRALAAAEMGMPCPSVELGDTDPRDYVLGQNKHRRHATQAQMALAVTAVHAWRPVGKPKRDNDLATPANPAPGAGLEKSTAQLAEMAGTSTRTIEQAKTVQTKATPEVKDAVKAGKIGLKKAAKIAELPKEEQAAAIDKPTPKKAKPAKPPPEPKVDAEDVPYEGPSEAEMAATMAAVAADDAALKALLESDYALAAVVEENKRMAAEIAILKLQRDGFMNRSNELVRRVKWLKGQLKKATTSGDDPRASARLPIGTRPALQLKARMEGIPTPVYGLAQSYHKR